MEITPLEDPNEEMVEGEAVELIYFDEQTGLYYDQLGNLIEFNPEDYIIEDQPEN